MWKLVQLECRECGHQFEDYISTDGDGCGECPLCHMPATQTIGLSCYGKHCSWSEWRAMDNNRS